MENHLQNPIFGGYVSSLESIPVSPRYIDLRCESVFFLFVSFFHRSFGSLKNLKKTFQLGKLQEYIIYYTCVTRWLQVYHLYLPSSEPSHIPSRSIVLIRWFSELAKVGYMIRSLDGKRTLNCKLEEFLGFARKSWTLGGLRSPKIDHFTEMVATA